jgi:hypothetical protein
MNGKVLHILFAHNPLHLSVWSALSVVQSFPTTEFTEGAEMVIHILYVHNNLHLSVWSALSVVQSYPSTEFTEGSERLYTFYTSTITPTCPCGPRFPWFNHFHPRNSQKDRRGYTCSFLHFSQNFRAFRCLCVSSHSEGILGCR